MKRFLILIILAACSGCVALETAARVATEAAVAALKAELPALAAPILDEAKKLADKGVEAGLALAADKAADAADAVLLKMLRLAGVDPMHFDADGDGKLNEAEMTIALQESKGRKDIPWWFQALAASGALGALVTVGAGSRKYAASKRKAEIVDIVTGGKPRTT